MAAPKGNRNAAGNHGGAPRGNSNARGNAGGAKKGNKNAVKHGGYEKLTWADLTDAECSLVTTMPADPEDLLLDQIRLLTVREHRIMKRISAITAMENGLVVDNVVRTEEKRQFKTEEEQQLYDERIAEMNKAGYRLPGHPYHLQTRTEATHNIIIRLEEVLTRIQDEKRRCLDSLAGLRRKGGISFTATLVDDWVTAVLEADVEVN